MTPADHDHLLARFNRNAPAAREAIHELERSSSLSLPAEYLNFLRQSNGGEGFVGDEYLCLWRAEELVEFNTGYEVAEFVPELFLFGSNGGGESFAFDRRSNPWSIVMVPFIPLELKEALPIASTFAEFFQALSRG